MLNKSTPITFIIIQLLADVLLTFSLIQADMFPLIYIVLAIFIEFIFLVISIVLSFAKSKRRQNYVVAFRRIIALLISVMVLSVAIFSFLVLNKVGDTIMGITSKDTVTTVVGVYVRADDPAVTIEDAEDYLFGYSEAFEADNTRAALKAIKKEIGSKPATESYDDIMTMVQGLYSGDVDAMVLSESYAAIVADQEGFENFENDTKLIYEFQIVSKVKKTEKKKPGDLSSFVVYLSGSDTRNPTLDVSRSDVNILMAVNTKTKEVVLINTPRDYYVPISISSSGTRDKLTHCGIYGIDCSMDTLAALYGHDVDYYAQINFTGFETLIDAVGGITVNADTSFSVDDLTFNAGPNELNGKQALVFARDRYHQAGGDNGRGRNQMKVITAVIEKMSAGTVLAHYSDILSSLEGMFVTDMSSDDINALVKMQLSDMSSWHVHSYAVTGSDGMSTTYSMPGTNAYVMYPNQQTVRHASDLIDKVLSGESISDSDIQ